VTESTSSNPGQLIKDAAKHGELVVFVGSGASMLCGSPDWRGFSNQVVNAIERTGKLTFLEAEQLRSIGDARRTLSIAMDIAHESGICVDFDGILHPDAAKPEGLELYEMLASLRPVFVTTNYDKWLDWEAPTSLVETGITGDEEPARGPMERPKYFWREHLTSEKLTERGAVIHLHGSYSEPSSMVVSLRDYIEHYADERVKTFLNDMFRNHTVLFIGYGLGELEILDHIVRSNAAATNNDISKEARHFILYPHRSSEAAQTSFIERFFRRQCGVQVIPYCIDTKGYGELLEVLKAWAPQLDVRDPTFLDLQCHIDRCVADGATDSQREAAIRLVRKKPELTAYFLNSLKDPVWFEDLDEAGFFDVSNSPEVRVIHDEKGTSFQADGWPALRYLEHIASQVMGERAERIASIARKVTKDAQAKGLDNWRTWWSLAIAFSHLPLEAISQDDVELIRTWVSGRFQADMVCREVGETLLPRLLESPDASNWEKALAIVDILTTLRMTEAQP